MIKSDSGTARALSLLIAISISIGLLAWPHFVVNADGRVNYPGLLILMWAMAAGFVHGVGFIPRNKILRLALGPVAASVLPLVTILAIVIFF
jgi:predicted membrane protein